MQQIFKFFIITLILGYAHSAVAIKFEQIYHIEIEVSSKELSKEQLDLIMQQEFAKITKKLTGRVDTIPITEADHYITRYEYQDLDLNSGKIALKIYFDKHLIEKKLASNKQAFLAEYRPVTIIWPKTDNPILLETMQELLHKIAFMAKDYGLPIIHPVLDLKEVAILHQDLAYEDFKNSIIAASKKYNADQIIIANVSSFQDILTMNWRSLSNNWEFTDQVLENYASANNNVNFAPQAEAFIDKLMAHLINLHVGSMEAAKEIILLKVANINDLEDYVKVEKILQNLTVVNKLHAAEFRTGEIEFKIIATGGKQAIRNALAINQWLHEKDLQDNNAADPDLKSNNDLDLDLKKDLKSNHDPDLDLAYHHENMLTYVLSS